MSPHPDAVTIGGAQYLRNAKGDLQALANISPIDLLMDEMVRKCTAYAEDISAELSRFQLHVYADIAAFDALLAQEYGVTQDGESKGNRTFTSLDGCRQIKVQVADRIQLGPELQIAKRLLDEMILARANKEGADTFLVTLVTQAFKVDQEGKVDVGAILALRRMKVADPNWEKVTNAIDGAVRIIGTKRYVRFYRRTDANGDWQMVPLDIAKAIPTPADTDRRSLRRSVEEARELASVAATYLLDGAPVTALDRLHAAIVALGGTGVSNEDRAIWAAKFGAPVPTADAA
ncbi:DUF3164 family protein [Niveispirillum sp. KHB5.9]|uniref:DUF3164 family protein n=1 Tax=Niveispirillum sp. KHB5.9 TaxID=3400269 RepID=UPI003A83FD7D